MPHAGAAVKSPELLMFRFSRAREVNGKPPSERKWRAKQSQRDGVLCEPVCRVAIELLLMSALTGECPDVA